MSLLSSLTYLTVAGFSGLAPWTEGTPVDVEVSDTASIAVAETEPSTVDATDAVQYTALAPTALPSAPYGEFEAATPPDQVNWTVSDTAAIAASEDPVDERAFETTETARLAVSETTTLVNSFAVTDTASLTLSESVSLSLTGQADKTASDTADLTLDEAVDVSVTVDTTDDAAIAVDDESAVEASVEAIEATDDASLMLDEFIELEIFEGILALSTVDSAALTLSETSSVSIPLNEPPPPRRVFRVKPPRRVWKV